MNTSRMSSPTFCSPSTSSLGSVSQRSISGASLSYRLRETKQRSIRSNSVGSRPTSVIDADSGVELQRHQDLWFPDGSVILRAQTTLFLVHMSQLSRRSEVFKGMFEMPQPKLTEKLVSGTGTLEGCDNIPIVELHDSADDLANLLVTLYDGTSFGDNGKEDFECVSGILRLCTKYMIDNVRERAIEHLSKAWPTTLKGWDMREDLARTFEVETSSSRGHFYPSPMAVISLAREVEAYELLPSAFYALSTYPFSQIFDPSPEDHLYDPSNSRNMLSAIDTQRLTLGKETMQNVITGLIQTMGQSQYLRQSQHPSGPTHVRKMSTGVCVSAAACRKDFSELITLATQHYLFDRERGFSDPLYVAEELGQLKGAEFSECKACAKALETWAARERQRLWKMIPTWFRLDTIKEGPSD